MTNFNVGGGRRRSKSFDGDEEKEIDENQKLVVIRFQIFFKNSFFVCEMKKKKRKKTKLGSASDAPTF